MAQSYGTILDPYRKLKEPLGVKGERQSIVITNNPSTIDQNETLTVRFPNLGEADVIVPGTVRLGFQIELDSKDPNRSVVPNLGRAIVKKVTIKLEGREVLSLHNSDIFFTYCDLWLSKNELLDLAYQGIESENGLKHRVGAADAKPSKKDEAIAMAYGNRFCIPLDFELLNTHLPYYQGALKDRLSYELTFNRYGDVIEVPDDDDAKYKISNISLEFDVVRHQELARLISQQYQAKLPIYYERVLHHSTIPKRKSDTIWNINLNTPARSLKGILMLFRDAGGGSRFFNPKITRLTCTIEGQPNQIYANGILPHQHFDEIRKYLGGGRLRDPMTDLVSKNLHEHDVRLDEYLTSKYGLWLDLRSNPDNKLHGSGRRVENASEGITIQIHKEQGDDKGINVYLFVVCDAQLNIEDNRLKDVVY